MGSLPGSSREAGEFGQVIDVMMRLKNRVIKISLRKSDYVFYSCLCPNPLI